MCFHLNKEANQTYTFCNFAVQCPVPVTMASKYGR